MRTWPRSTSLRVLTAAAVTGGLVAASAGTAAADLIVNGVDDTIDTTVELMPLSLSTGAGKTTIYAVPAEGDGDPGCNLDGGTETVTLNIASDNTTVATVSPSTLVLSACGAAGAQTVTVTPVGVGTANFTTTVAAGLNKSGGTYSIANARFSAKVTSVPNTPPKLDIVGVEEGGSYARGSLQRPTCVATDPDDFPTAPHTKTWSAPMTEISGPYAVDSIGVRAAQCSYVDGDGVQVLARKVFSIIDESAPVISRTLNPTTPANGWFRGDVTLTHAVTEHQSPSSLQPLTGCEPVTVSEDTRLRTVTCSATSVGGTNTVATNIRRDATAPVVSPTSTVAGGTVVNGWYTSPVGVTFTASDPTSSFLTSAGTVSTTASQTVTSTTDGEALIESPAFTDRAGNASAVGVVKRTVKVDTKAPNAPLASFSTPAGTEGWHTAPVTVTFSPAGDVGSGVASCTAPVTVDVDTVGETVSGTCTDHAGHSSAAQEVTVKLDRGAPVVTRAVVVAPPTGANGWYTNDVDVDFSATDEVSGLATATQRVTSSGEGEAVGVSSPAFTDHAGNIAAAGAVTKAFKVDKTAPAVPAFVGGPSGSHYFGESPAAPTCTSSDTGSGLASCVVSGGGSTVGKHTYTATATDNAGHTSTAQLSYAVLAWTAKPFTSPIDMSTSTTPVFNTIKGGSTVPAKFEVFAGSRELSDLDAVTLTNRKIACTTGAAADDIEVTTSGSTSLKYDTTAGQYQYNWKLPTGPGTCYELKMTADDGSIVTANFKLK